MLDNMTSNQKKWESHIEAEKPLEEVETGEPNLDMNLHKLKTLHLRRRHRFRRGYERSMLEFLRLMTLRLPRNVLFSPNIGSYFHRNFPVAASYWCLARASSLVISVVVAVAMRRLCVTGISTHAPPEDVAPAMSIF